MRYLDTAVIACLLLLTGPLGHASDPGASRAALAQSLRSWKEGDRARAMDAAVKAVKLDPSVEAILNEAKLLDAAGDAAHARTLYKSSLPLLGARPESGQIRLRLALLSESGRDTREFAQFARTADGELRNRSAIVLALMGDHEEALELYRPATGPAGAARRDQLRLAEWALKAKNLQAAKVHALEATRTAVHSTDRRYAISLQVEAYRAEGTLDQLIREFESKRALTAEGRDALAELLREKGEVTRAIEVFKRGRAGKYSPEERQQLIRLALDAKQSSVIQTEYRHLIAEQPEEVSWVAALSEYQVVAGKRETALQVWTQFLDGHRNRRDLRLAAVPMMSQMGFDALAVQSIEADLTGHPSDGRALLALADLHESHGRTTDALAALAKLDACLPPASAARADLADALERFGKPEAAIKVWEALMRTPEGLGFEGRMRLARLYDTTKRPQKALEAWRSLWGEASTPAQRSLVEDRLLTKAVEQNQVESLAIELEARLADRRADANDSSLLARLYTRVGEKTSAIEVIKESQGNLASPVDVLKEQARVYRTLKDHEGLVRVHRQLMRTDPTHKADYLRGIIVDRVAEGGPDLVTDLRALFAEVRKVTTSPPDAGFEAGVLSLAGLHEEAIKGYREAIARDPAHGDNYLLLAAELKADQKGDEAVTLLQYTAETTQSDDLFTIAIDGILNVLAQEDYERLPEQSQAVLRWVQHMALERLIRVGESASLYHIIADVSEDLHDAKMKIAAVDATLALDTTLRVAALRQLFTLTAPDAAEARATPGAGGVSDDAKNALYGRRLMAVSDVLPPDVYLQLGKSFLARGEVAVATKAFDRAIDVNARSDLQGRVAELFETKGYDKEAKIRYSIAVIADSDNVRLLHKLARLNERLGAYGEAFQLYGRALTSLLVQQPAEISATATPQMQSTRDYRDHYEALMQGFVANWPNDAKAQMAAVQSIDGVIQAELNTPPSVERELLRRPRLTRAAEALRRIAFSTGQIAVADELDSRILEEYSQDPGLILTLVGERMAWGYWASARKLADGAKEPTPGVREKLQEMLAVQRPDKPVSVSDAIARGMSTGSFEEARQVSAISGSSSQVLAVARAWASKGAYVDALLWAEARLDERDRANLARYVSSLASHDDKALKDAFSPEGGPLASNLTRIIRLAGAPVFSVAQLKGALRDSILTGREVLPLMYTYVADSMLPAAMINLTVDATSSLRGSQRFWPWLRLWKALVVKPLSSADSRRLSENVEGVLNAEPEALKVRHEVLWLLAGTADIDPSNVLASRELADRWRATAGLAVDYFKPFYLLKAGKTQEAVQAYVEVVRQILPQLSQDDRDGKSIASLVYEPLTETFVGAHHDKVSARLDELEAVSGTTPELLKLRDTILHQDGDRGVALLEKGLHVDPANPDYPMRLHRIYQGSGWWHDAQAVYEHLFLQAPGNILYRSLLYHDLRTSDLPERALAMNESSAEDMTAPGFMKALEGRAADLSGSQSLEFPHDTAIAPVLDSDAVRLPREIARADEARDTTRTRIALRTFWRSGSVGTANDYQSMNYAEMLSAPWRASEDFAQLALLDSPSDLLQTLRGAADGPKLFERMVGRNFAVDEFEDELRGIDAKDRDTVARLYEYLASAYAGQGHAEEKLAALAPGVRDGTTGDHEFTLWLKLAEPIAGQRRPDVLEVLNSRIDQAAILTPSQMISVARILAAEGQMDRAAAVYSSLAQRTLMMPTGQRENGSPQLARQLNGVSLMDEIASHLEPRQRITLLQGVLNVTQPDEAFKARAASNYAQFVMRATSGVLNAQTALKRSAALLGEDRTGWTPEAFLELAGLQAQAGMMTDAARTLSLAAKSRTDIGFNGSVIDMQKMDVETRAQWHARMLGVASPTPVDLAAQAAARVFPPAKNSWSGAREWMRTATDALDAGLSDPGTDRDSSVQMLAVIAYRLKETGDHEGAVHAIGLASKALMGRADLKLTSVNRVLAVSDAIAVPVDLSALKAMIGTGRLELPRIAPTVRRVAREEGTTQALALAEKAAQQTHDDRLLEVLAEVASAAGNGARAQYWKAVRAQAAEARVKLRWN